MPSSTKWNSKKVRFNDQNYRMCMWSGVLVKMYYAVRCNDKRKGCFHDPCAAASWIRNQNMNFEKETKLLQSIIEDLGLGAHQPLLLAPEIDPTRPNFGYLHNSYMAVFEAQDVDTEPEPERKRSINASDKEYKTEKRVYAYNMPEDNSDRTTTVVTDYKKTRSLDIETDTVSLQTYKGKDVILLWNSGRPINNRVRAMFPGLAANGDVWVLSRKQLHDDGSAPAEATAKKPRLPLLSLNERITEVC